MKKYWDGTARSAAPFSNRVNSKKNYYSMWESEPNKLVFFSLADTVVFAPADTVVSVREGKEERKVHSINSAATVYVQYRIR